jgi:DNA polymerase-3 subunit alpha
MYDFCSRNYNRNFNRRALEGLIKSGAMDALEDNRRKMLYNIDKVLSVIDETQRFSSEDQLDLFGESNESVSFQLAHIEEMPLQELLAMEKNATGMYLSGHPMNSYRAFAKNARFIPIADVNSKKIADGRRISVIGVLGDVKLKQLKNKNTIAYTTLEDATGTIDVIVFSTVLSSYRAIMNEGSVVIINGKVSEREDRDAELVCESVEQVPESAQNAVQMATLYLKIPSLNSPKFNLVCDALSKHSGDSDVIIVCEDTSKRIMAPDRLKIRPSNEIVEDLSKILGVNNVKLVIK